MQTLSQKLKCLYRGCSRTFRSQHGRTYHMRAVHNNSNKHTVNVGDAGMAGGSSNQASVANNHGPGKQRIEHPHLRGTCSLCPFVVHSLLKQPTALPCDANGDFLPPGAPPPPQETAQQGDWTPFDSEIQFKVADLLYRSVEMSVTSLNTLFELWDLSMSYFDARGPFQSHQEMHDTIDSSVLGDIPWQCLVTGISDNVTEHSPTWMQTRYEIWYRNPEAVVAAMLANQDFKGQFDLCPYIDLDASGRRRWNNVMSGNIAWHRCVSSMFLVPQIRVLTTPLIGRYHSMQPRRRRGDVLPDYSGER